MSKEKANQRETSYREQIKNLTVKLKQAEARADFAVKSIKKLKNEVCCVKVECFIHFLSIIRRLTDWKMN